MDSLYREEILEHFRNPLNFGKLKKFDSSSKQVNPFCGDEIEMFVKFEPLSAGVDAKTPQGCRISEVKFVGKGCAICMAGASMLTEYSKGKTKKVLTKFSEKDMLGMLNIEISQTRKKCALLGLGVLKDCLNPNLSEGK